jgi:replicative DNA helicase
VTSQQSDPLDIIFSPAQVARVGTANIEERVANRGNGVPFGVPVVDEKFLPMLPGELAVIISRPGHGKSAHLMRWARHRANWLQTNQKHDRVVVYLTLEQSVEELYSFHVSAECGIAVDLMARGTIDETQLEIVRDYGIRRSTNPLWFMGFSSERRKKRPRTDLESVDQSLRRIENWGMEGKRELKIDFILIDYLQRLPFVGSQESKTIGMDDNLNRMKDLGMSFGCPVAAGVQARREVDSYSVPIPEMWDGQWTSAIEQVPDRVMASVRPIKYKKEGESFGKTIVEGRNQNLLALWKQRMGDAPFSWWLMFDMAYNRLNDAEERNYDLNKMAGSDY